LDLRCFGLIVFARDLDPRLNLADRYDRDMQVLVSDASQPSENGAMRANPAQLRYDVCIEEIHPRVRRVRAPCAGSVHRGEERSILLALRPPAANPSGWASLRASVSARL